MEFSELASALDYPLYVVTTAVDGEPTGCLVGFATQCGIQPPRFLACISKKNHTFHMAGQAARLAVHVVERDKKSLARIFGGETGDRVDKFAQLEWHVVDGVPVLNDCRRWFIGEVLQRIDLGDHIGHLLEPCKVQAGTASAQLLFQQARDIKPGHKP